MITKHSADQRGQTDLGWLKSQHSFSFGRFIDHERMGFGPLRVINDDIVQGGMGFSEHAHDNMEIFSYIVSGKLKHHDGAGHESVIGTGGVQVMSAGSGIRHSEMNGSSTDPVRFLQIWIEPRERDTAPRYNEKTFDDLGKKWRLILSPDAREGSLPIGQDVEVYATRLSKGNSLAKQIIASKKAWLQVVKGALALNGENYEVGDGVQIVDEAMLEVVAQADSEILLILFG